MQVFASMDAAIPLDQVAAYATRVEALGYDGIHVAETVHDVFLAALLAIQGSERLIVRSSVAVAFPRSPMVVALAAWDLSRLSGGRFDLGLGTQVKANLEGRYSTAWTPPVSRMREYVGWHALDAVVDDALLDAVAPSATYADLPGLLRTRFAMADQLVVTPPADPADDAAFATVVRELQAP